MPRWRWPGGAIDGPLAICPPAAYIDLLRSWVARQDNIPRGRTIPMGAVPALARGLWHTAPTYLRRRPGSTSNGLLGSALASNTGIGARFDLDRRRPENRLATRVPCAAQGGFSR